MGVWCSFAAAEPLDTEFEQTFKKHADFRSDVEQYPPSERNGAHSALTISPTKELETVKTAQRKRAHREAEEQKCTQNLPPESVRFAKGGGKGKILNDEIKKAVQSGG